MPSFKAVKIHQVSLKRWRSAFQKRKKMAKLVYVAGKDWETWVFHEVRGRIIEKIKS